MNCERHAASTELCLTISKAEVSLRFPSEKILATPLIQQTSLRTTRFEKKKLKRKKRRRKNRKKNATDTNQQLYQKNYHSGLKDKCPETKKEGRTKRNMIPRRRLSRKDSKTKCKLHKQFLGPQASSRVTPCSPASNHTRGEVLNKHK